MSNLAKRVDVIVQHRHEVLDRLRQHTKFSESLPLHTIEQRLDTIDNQLKAAEVER